MPEINETVRVRAPREQVYEMWRDPDTFVTIVGGLDEAERDGRSLQWSATGPFGLTMRGEAEITKELPPERLAWNTIEGTIDAHGCIELEAEDGATVVRYQLRYEVPGGTAGKALAGAADTEGQVRETLERFRELAEERASEG